MAETLEGGEWGFGGLDGIANGDHIALWAAGERGRAVCFDEGNRFGSSATCANHALVAIVQFSDRHRLPGLLKGGFLSGAQGFAPPEIAALMLRLLAEIMSIKRTIAA